VHFDILNRSIVQNDLTEYRAKRTMRFMETIPDIKRLRRELCLTCEELGQKLGGLSHSTISRWERGVSKPRGLVLRELRALEVETFGSTAEEAA
tara:strand:+ start:7479 stop:7760 length:282 start_codon:yes stop_codon:yes gene_type:complete